MSSRMILKWEREWLSQTLKHIEEDMSQRGLALAHTEGTMKDIYYVEDQNGKLVAWGTANEIAPMLPSFPGNYLLSQGGNTVPISQVTIIRRDPQEAQ